MEPVELSAVRVSCSDPMAEHLLIEGLDHYGLRVPQKVEWVHWHKEARPVPGDILQICERPPQRRTATPASPSTHEAQGGMS
jgi:hypothetical protein